MTREQLFDLLRPIIMAATGVPECILADDNGPSPEGVYASIEPMASIAERGQAIIRRTSTGNYGEAAEDVEAQLIAECSVNFYRGEARILAARLKQANRRSSISGMLRTAGLGWLRTNQVNNLTALQSDQREQRAQLSVYIAFIDKLDPVIIPTIEAVEIEVQDHKGRVIARDEAYQLPPLPENSLAFNDLPLSFDGAILTFN